MYKRLIALPFLAVLLTAPVAAQTPQAPLSWTAPAEIAADPANRLNFELSSGGTVVIQLRPDVAPNHVYRFQQLASSGFYNGQSFHRVIAGFMAQSGDPTGTGQGGSKLPDLNPEFSALPHLRGVLSMARAQALNSANSQFYIMLSASLVLDGKYTVLGRVISGMDAVDRIAVGEPPVSPTKIVRAWIDGPLPPPSAAPAAEPAPLEAAPGVEPAPTEAAPAQ